MTTTETNFETAIQRIRSGEDHATVTEDLLGALAPQEKLQLLDGDLEFWPGLASMMLDGYNRIPIVHGRIDRVGIPGLRFSDGPRGVVMGASTAFPVSMARGATWDVDLEERIGRAIGAEMRAQGANFFGGVCINLPRHPAWGRVQETYGEDPIILGEFGAALVRGVREHAMAVAKHYVLNSMENARFRVDVTVDDAALHEVYLAHFRRVVEEGVSAIMTSYNSVNGQWAGQNEPLMEGVLRKQWGFSGITVSDFIWGLRDASLSLHAGLDVEEPFRQQRAQYLGADSTVAESVGPMSIVPLVASWAPNSISTRAGLRKPPARTSLSVSRTGSSREKLPRSRWFCSRTRMSTAHRCSLSSWRPFRHWPSSDDSPMWPTQETTVLPTFARPMWSLLCRGYGGQSGRRRQRALW